MSRDAVEGSPLLLCIRDRGLLLLCRLDAQPERRGAGHPWGHDGRRCGRNGDRLRTFVSRNIGKRLRKSLLRRGNTLGSLDRNPRAEGSSLGHAWDDIGGSMSGRERTRPEPRLPSTVRRLARVRGGILRPSSSTAQLFQHRRRHGPERARGEAVVVALADVGELRGREGRGGGKHGLDLYFCCLCIRGAHDAVLGSGGAVERAEGVGGFPARDFGVGVAHERVPYCDGAAALEDVDPDWAPA